MGESLRLKTNTTYALDDLTMPEEKLTDIKIY